MDAKIIFAFASIIVAIIGIGLLFSVFRKSEH